MKRALAVLLTATMLFCSVQSVWAEGDTEWCNINGNENARLHRLMRLLLAIESARR